MNERLRELDDLFRQAERAISLLVRTRPRAVARARARLLRDWSAGRQRAPHLEYAPAPDLSSLRRTLEDVSRVLEGGPPLAALYAARARELVLEARIVEAVGSAHVRLLARERFEVPRATIAETRRWIEVSLAMCGAPGEEPPVVHASDDASDPESLVSELRRRIGAARLPVRVELSDELLACAAAGDGIVVVRRGVLQRASEARRTALHELEGHVVPRLRARQHRLGLFAVGSAGSAEDEEGRALWLEREAGLLDHRRSAALARRHLAAEAVRDGSDFVETARLVIARGAALDEALETALRCHRGGGLAREITYLPALARFESAVRSGFDANRWLRQGRLSVEAARQLETMDGHEALQLWNVARPA